VNRKQALELSLLAGDENARLAGRTEWAVEDTEVATKVFNSLFPVRKMDEITEAAQ
jgi:hypothetical protein